MVDDKIFSRQILLDALNKMSIIENWRAAVGAIFMASNASDDEIADGIHKAIPGLTFIVSEIEIATSQGIADKKTWDFITFPKRVS
jgi:hypothetical protein